MIGVYDIEEIDSETNTLSITRSNNERDTSCRFQTRDPVHEWDEIIVENDYETRLFAGILETPDIGKEDNATLYTASSHGYQKLFDRLKVEEAFEDELAGDIVRDIVASYAADFTVENVEDGFNISKVVYNYVLPSEGIRRIADALGYRWHIDQYKDIHFVANDATEAPKQVVPSEHFYSNLHISPDVSSLANVVIVRGGTYRSEQVDYFEIADGEKTQFLLPEKPHEIHVFVNGVEKTVGIKFGQGTPVQDFQVNFNEKYIENGTLATLSDGDEFHVAFTYDVPIRVRRRNAASVTVMALLFPGTNGEFEKVIHDKDIVSREIAYQTAQQHLDAYSNALVSGSFNTQDDIFEPGEVLVLNVPEFAGSASIQSIDSTYLDTGLWKHTVKFATVLFGFEEFMRELYAAKKVELIDGETLETSTELEDTVTLSEMLTVSIDLNRQEDTIGVEEDVAADINFGEEYVLAPYFPSDHSDPKRVFILDGSVMV